ncbi:hypothetical protein CD29_08520 [Ureibacillus manganicus DSM 26584]|uniref:Uncharacterized protein n=1 Tax=Ureibacillus manganicus DSM 26584 TaxID=1384049 RepID=A0A0A3IW39_9BACL|nr:hypothetical protein CD29_08520 [Ureibacillus manganicus DSM 26584]
MCYHDSSTIARTMQSRAKKENILRCFLLLLNLYPYAQKKTAAANFAKLCKYGWVSKMKLLKKIEINKVVVINNLNHHGSLKK